MTDKEIIQAFECCTKIEEGCGHEYCFKCPMIEEDVDECTASLFGKVLDLIKRQQAEIERLKMEREALDDAIYPLPFKTDFDIAIETAKVEAYKEFAERLKSIIRDMRFLAEAEYQCEYIDDLVKELTEVKDDVNEHLG